MLSNLCACPCRIALVLFTFVIYVFPAQAAQFTAGLTITSTQGNFVYDLAVKDNLIRLEKTEGPMTVSPFPTIYNRSSGVTWGLNPQVSQYVEESDPVKTMMMNPVAGWEYMRKDMKGTPVGTETVEGYLCDIVEYREMGKDSVASRVWVSKELGFTVKEVTYGLNGNPTMVLSNIKEEPVDAALFTIPPGYTKAGGASGSPDQNTKKPAKAKKQLSTTVLVKPTSAEAIGLEPNRTITITATGDDPGDVPSTVDMKVLSKNKGTILSEKIALKSGETQTWEVPAEKLPYDLYLNGGTGQVRFTVEQRADVLAGDPKTVPKAAVENSMTVSPTTSVSGNIIFILDASGSMWGQVEGVAKITIAKEVLSGLIQDLPDEAVVGLVAYGHRREGDCDDVQELIALGPLDKEKMVGQIKALSPKGKTPISRSVRVTAERIKHLEDETTIILVSDGKETCDPDPCGLVKELKAVGIKFVMHVIGFDVTEAEREELECMAQAGGGQYYTAGNAKDFQLAAQEVVKKATPPYGILRVTATKNGQPFFTAVKITNLESGKSWSPASSSGETGIAEIHLEPGNYTAELKDTGVSGGKTPAVELTDIVIVAGETVDRSADFSDGMLVITTLLNGSPFEGHIFYFRQGEKKPFHNENANPKTGQLKRQLLPGVYRVEVKTDSIAGKPTVVIDLLEILPGSTVEKTAEFFSGEVTVAATLNGEPYNMPFKIYDSSGKEFYKASTEGRTKGQRLVRLPAGAYTIKVTTNVDSSTKSFENVIVETEQFQTVEADFWFGKLTIAATLNGQPYNTPFEVYDSTGKKVLGKWTQGNVQGQRTEMLPEGLYTIKIISIKDKNQVLMFENVEVKNGETTERTGTFTG